ncbi:PREDICTED: tubulin-specific chaperone E-like isoform X2 [Priapulus caudatus]|uniref:Tubulin-specific chaperone E n=1 Tax=Priapulus caudatus TaxID=37621 RepID=A0ABM1DXT9_PRICU|nr:PREDICTED: tubulin-specific chaperone E-like isoform X2 [Priapulus caudatus]
MGTDGACNVPVLSIGSRVQCDGHIATVKYIGQVTGTKGEWLGVEWDDPSRGKHDGSHNQSRYFITSHPTSGSFVRLGKISTGISVSDAIHEKYSQPIDVASQEAMFVRGVRGSTKAVEFVGADKIRKQQSKLNLLKTAVLDHMSVSYVSPDSLLEKHMPDITELDLSANLFTSWEMVSMATVQLKNLRILNVSNNALNLPPDDMSLIRCFSQVTSLTMNRMRYTWEQVLYLMPMFPHLEQLYISFNDITTLSDPGNSMASLQSLVLEGNPLTGWSESVLPLGDLPCLTELNLNSTGLTEISFPGRDRKTTLFEHLKVLYLSNNEIGSWRDVSALDRLQSLQELTFHSNALSRIVNQVALYDEIVCRVAGLQLLNRSREDRQGAEIVYVKKYGRDWLAAGGRRESKTNNPSAEFLLDHPRYEELIASEVWSP